MRIRAVLATLVLGSILGCYGKHPNQQQGNSAPQGPATPEAPAADDGTPAAPAGPHPGLLDPTQANEQAPDVYRVKLETTKGDVLLELHRDWSPHGADRFYNLVKVGYFDDVAFFRAMEGFMVQFGMSGDPQVNAAWSSQNLPDDPVKESNKRGYITFAKKNTPNTRTTQVFINYKDNGKLLDGMGFAPFGQVVEGMEVLDSLYKGYGDGAPRGKGPMQPLIEREGNAYLRRDFPELDYLKKATVVDR